MAQDHRVSGFVGGLHFAGLNAGAPAVVVARIDYSLVVAHFSGLLLKKNKERAHAV